MKNKLFILVSTLNLLSLFSQDTEKYTATFNLLNNMLNDEIEFNFKDAVFSVENAFYDGILNRDDLEQEIKILMQMSKIISDSELITYNNRDKETIIKHASLYKIMTEAISINLGSTTFVHQPYTYDFTDPFGQTDWSSMFVSKLLETGKGNCHSLPYLYKILSDELNIPCYLAFAPNHIYIKLFSEQTGWYNTELTTGTFPVDAWIMASGYISIDAIYV